MACNEIRLLIAVLAAILLASSPVFGQSVSLPDPSGKFRVGTTIRFFTDDSREEPWTRGTDDRRRLAVQFWYPTDASSGKEAPYIPQLEAIRSSIEKYWGGIPQVASGAFLDAPPLRAEGGRYVVVLSHGMNSPRFVYTSISRELASRGYVVAAIDHSFWGPAVAFPEGGPVGFQDGMIALDTLGPDEIDSMMVEGINVMAADQAFVAGRILDLNRTDPVLRDTIRVGRMAAVGHSMGGMAAMASCLRYTAFSACASLDGVNYFLNKMPKPSPKPLLLLLNSQWGRGAPEKIADRYLEAFERPQVAILNGSKHNYFSDIPLIEKPATLEGLIAPDRAFRIIAEETAAFLDSSLKGIGNRSEKAAELETVDLQTLQTKRTSP